jgi:hypothetical protein
MKVLRSSSKLRTSFRVECACGALLEVEVQECKCVLNPCDGDYLETNCPECNRLVTYAVSLLHETR